MSISVSVSSVFSTWKASNSIRPNTQLSLTLRDCFIFCCDVLESDLLLIVIIIIHSSSIQICLSNKTLVHSIWKLPLFAVTTEVTVYALLIQ